MPYAWHYGFELSAEFNIADFRTDFIFAETRSENLVIREVELARKKEYCSQAFRDEVFDLLQKYGWETKAIPSIVKGGGVGERFLTVMHNDKKNKSEKVRLIISKDLCNIITEETDDEDILSVLK